MTKRSKEQTPDKVEEPIEAELPSDDGRALLRPSIAVPGPVRPALKRLGHSMLWLYGAPKVGKTTMMSKFPGLWCLATEPGQDWIDMRQPTIIHSWEHFLEVCAYIETEKPMKFSDGETIHWLGIDTVDLLFRMCNDDVCRGLGVEDPSELGHGKAWARLSHEFERVITKIRRWPFGLLCISHAREKSIVIRGSQRTRTEPDIGAAGMRCLASASDLILNLQTDSLAALDDNNQPTGEITEQQVLLCRSNSWCVAGGRMSDRLPDKLVLDRDDPYGSIVAALEEGTEALRKKKNTKTAAR